MEIKNSKNLAYDELVQEVISGKLIIYPTDTVYGVGCIPEANSCEKIYEVKERKKDSPLIALVSNKDIVEEIACYGKNEKLIKKLIEEFWPGALTIILDKKDKIPAEMVSYGTSVGVRMPNLEVATSIIEACGGVLATTSSNISGEPSPKSFYELSEKIKERVEVVVEYNRPIHGLESTIIDMRDKPKVLRQGKIKKEELEKIIGNF